MLVYLLHSLYVTGLVAATLHLTGVDISENKEAKDKRSGTSNHCDNVPSGL